VSSGADPIGAVAPLAERGLPGYRHGDLAEALEHRSYVAAIGVDAEVCWGSTEFLLLGTMTSAGAG